MACFFLSRIYWSLLDHDLMASIWEKAISILAGNLNSGCSNLITAVFLRLYTYPFLLWRHSNRGNLRILPFRWAKMYEININLFVYQPIKLNQVEFKKFITDWTNLEYSILGAGIWLFCSVQGTLPFRWGLWGLPTESPNRWQGKR